MFTQNLVPVEVEKNSRNVEAYNRDYLGCPASDARSMVFMNGLDYVLHSTKWKQPRT